MLEEAHPAHWLKAAEPNSNFSKFKDLTMFRSTSNVGPQLKFMLYNT